MCMCLSNIKAITIEVHKLSNHWHYVSYGLPEYIIILKEKIKTYSAISESDSN